jgi:hypothetical protein
MKKINKSIFSVIIFTVFLFVCSGVAFAADSSNERVTISVTSEQPSSIVNYEDGSYETMNLSITTSNEKEAKAGKPIKNKKNSGEVSILTTDYSTIKTTGYYNVATTREVWGVYLAVRYKLFSNVYYNATTKQFKVNWTDNELKCYFSSIASGSSSKTLVTNSTVSAPAKTLGTFNGNDTVYGWPVTSWTYKIYQDFYYGGSIKAWNVKI